MTLYGAQVEKAGQELRIVGWKCYVAKRWLAIGLKAAEIHCLKFENYDTYDADEKDFSLSLNWLIERKILILSLHLANSEPSVLHCTKDAKAFTRRKQLNSYLHFRIL